MSALIYSLKPNYDDKLYGSTRKEYENHVILTFVNRVTDKKLIKSYSKGFDVIDVPTKHSIFKYGLKIEISSSGVNIYRNEKYPLSTGSNRWVFNLVNKNDKTSILYAISIEVVPTSPPNVVELTAKTRIEAALAVYRERVALAEIELRKELERISSISINEAAPPQTKSSNLKAVKRKKTLKRA